MTHFGHPSCSDTRLAGQSVPASPPGRRGRPSGEVRQGERGSPWPPPAPAARGRDTTAVLAWPPLLAQWVWLGLCSPRRCGTEAGGVSPACSRIAWGARPSLTGAVKRDRGGPHGSAFRPGKAIVTSSQSSSSEELVHARLAAGVLRGRGCSALGHATRSAPRSKGFKQSFVQNTESNL